MKLSMIFQYRVLIIYMYILLRVKYLIRMIFHRYETKINSKRLRTTKKKKNTMGYFLEKLVIIYIYISIIYISRYILWSSVKREKESFNNLAKSCSSQQLQQQIGG